MLDDKYSVALERTREGGKRQKKKRKKGNEERLNQVITTIKIESYLSRRIVFYKRSNHDTTRRNKSNPKQNVKFSVQKKRRC